MPPARLKPFARNLRRRSQALNGSSKLASPQAYGPVCVGSSARRVSLSGLGIDVIDQQPWQVVDRVLRVGGEEQELREGYRNEVFFAPLVGKAENFGVAVRGVLVKDAEPLSSADVDAPLRPGRSSCRR